MGVLTKGIPDPRVGVIGDMYKGRMALGNLLALSEMIGPTYPPRRMTRNYSTSVHANPAKKAKRKTKQASQRRNRHK